MNITKFIVALLMVSSSALAEETTANLDLARETISLMHVDRMLDGMTNQLKQMVVQQTQAMMPPNATDEERAKVQEVQTKIMDLAMAETKVVMREMDQVYADVYSEAELKAMISFFSSPEGQSMLAKQPQVMARTMPLVQAMQLKLAPQIKQLVEEAKQQK